MDEQVENQSDYQLYIKDGKKYSAYLTQDTKFYKIQVLEPVKKGIKPIFFSRYGKIDAVGKITHDECKNIGDAVKAYEKKYKDKSKTYEEEDEDQEEDAMQEEEENDEDEEENSQKKSKGQVDRLVPNGENYQVVQGERVYSAYLEQDTKFYLIQVLQSIKKPQDFFFFSRYGKIDADGNSSLSKSMKEAGAIKKFNDKYKEKVEKGDYEEIENEDEEEGDDEENEEEEEEEDEFGEDDEDEYGDEEDFEELKKKPIIDGGIDNPIMYKVQQGDGQFYSVYLENNDENKFLKMQIVYKEGYDDKGQTNTQYSFFEKRGTIMSQNDSQINFQADIGLEKCEQLYNEGLNSQGYKVVEIVEPFVGQQFFKPLMKHQYALFRKMMGNQMENNKIRQQLFEKFFPYKFYMYLEVGERKLMNLTKDDPEDYKLVTDLKFEIDYALEFFRRAPKILEIFDCKNLRSLYLDFQIDEDACDEERIKISKFLRNFTNLKKLDLIYMECPIEEEQALRLGKSISSLSQLEELHICLFETPLDGIKKFGDQIIKLENLVKLNISLDSQQEDFEDIKKYVQKKFSHLKCIKFTDSCNNDQ